MKILIADDSQTDVAIIGSILSDFELFYAFDGVEALEQLEKHPEIDILILDINMPRMSGFEVLERLQLNEHRTNLAVLVLTNFDEIDNEMRGLDLGAVDYIRKPLNIRSLRKRVELQIKLKNARDALEHQNSILEKRVQERTRESVLTRDVTIHALVSLLEVRNIESSNHTKRTQLMMRALCNHLRTKPMFADILTESYSAELFDTTPLHDIGKVGIPHEILTKPGPLSPEERLEVQRHPEIGYKIAKNIPELAQVSTYILAHHEWWNGRGYPVGLSGEGIPLPSRIIAVVDAFDVMLSGRVYRAARSREEALAELRRCAGTQFDPGVVDVLTEFSGDDPHAV